MGNPLLSDQLFRLLDDRLRKVFVEKWPELHAMIPQVYGVERSDKAWEEYFGLGETPDVQPFNGKVPYLSISPDFYSKVEHKEFAGGVQIERKLLDDDRYGVINKRQNGLVISAHRVREKYGVEGYAQAFSNAFTFMQSEEAVSLCNSAHTTKSGVSTASGFSNAGTSAITKSMISTTRILMRQYRNDIGERIEVEPDTLLVPDTQYDAACEAVGHNETGAHSDRDPDSAHYGKINPQYKRWTVIPYLRLDDYSTKSWYMIDSRRMKEFMVWFDRISPELETTRDFDSKMFKQSVYMRFSYGFFDWRWIYGHQVS